jgi:hypothetical protein
MTLVGSAFSSWRAVGCALGFLLGGSLTAVAGETLRMITFNLWHGSVAG